MHSIIFFFDDDLRPVRYCQDCTEQKQQQLIDIAERMQQAAINGLHVCQCAGKCMNRAA